MNEIFALAAILFLIYLTECICYVPDRGLAFKLHRKKPAKIVRPLFHIGSRRVNAFFGDLWPGSGEIAVCDSLPVPLSPLGICTCSAHSPFKEKLYIPFEEISELKVDGTEICDGRNTISKAISEPGALELAEFIRKLTSLSREERARIIRRKLRQSLNTTAAVQRFRRFNRLLYWPDWEARQLLFTLLVLLPASIWIAGWRRAWIMALACILFSIRQIFVFVQVHRVFQKNSTSARRSRVLALALAPPATIRVRDFLSRELLERFHPLAVARAVCSEEDSRQFTSIEFRKLKFPAAFEKSDTRCPVESWIREEWLKAVQDWAGTEFVDFRLLLQAPERQHPASQSYCPRCLQEYTQSGGECPDCPGVAREPLAPSSDSSL